MSSPSERPENDNYLEYAPKWARDPNHQKRHESPSIAEGELPQPNEQSLPEEDLASDQPRLHRPRDTTSLREPRLGPRAGRPPTEGQLPKAGQLRSPFERDHLRVPRSLDPEILREPPPAPPILGRLAALAGLIIAALAGAAIALFITAKFPSEWSKMLGLNTDKTEVSSKTEFGSRFAADTVKAPEQQSSPASPPVVSTTPAVEEHPARTASARETREGTPSVRGVTDNEIRLGISAPFTGSAKELGNQMKLGIETAFNLINDAGGIHGRQLKLVAADDGYEPTRTAETMKQLYEKEQVFGFIGNVGTPTAVVGMPYALERKMLFFGAFTGAGLLRRDPPDRYVFNYRASYAEETDAVVRYLVKVRGLRPEQIAVFAQQDAYGDSGFAGVAKAMRALRGGNEGAILRLDYKRNTVDVDDAVARLRAHKTPIKAVVMVPTYRAAAKFIEKTRDLYPTMIYTNVSFVGSTALADELMLLGPRYANGVIVTQVVPAVDSYASTVLKYKTALAKYFPAVMPDYVSLEGYVDGSILLEGLKRAGSQLNTEKLVDALETVRDFDMGLGTLISFGSTEHQGSHKVWGTQLNENGRYQAIDLQ
jgi:ABC-type branched-subunit amino acid transport system substrate-binding protein